MQQWIQNPSKEMPQKVSSALSPLQMKTPEQHASLVNAVYHLYKRIHSQANTLQQQAPNILITKQEAFKKELDKTRELDTALNKFVENISTITNGERLIYKQIHEAACKILEQAKTHVFGPPPPAPAYTLDSIFSAPDNSTETNSQYMEQLENLRQMIIGESGRDVQELAREVVAEMQEARKQFIEEMEKSLQQGDEIELLVDRTEALALAPSSSKPAAPPSQQAETCTTM